MDYEKMSEENITKGVLGFVLVGILLLFLIISIHKWNVADEYCEEKGYSRGIGGMSALGVLVDNSFYCEGVDGYGSIYLSDVKHYDYAKEYLEDNNQ